MSMMMLFAQAGADSAPMELGIRVPLSLMIFLEYAIWGAWYVVLGNYLNTLGFTRKEIGRVYATIPLGAILSPMLAGVFADRFMASEQLLAMLHLAGAALLVWMAYIRTPMQFFWVAFGYALIYTPTMSLSNAVVFANVPTSLDFPEIRVLGTIGWIVAGLSLRLFMKPGQAMNNSPLLLAAALSVCLGAYSFFLPHTPPRASGSGAEAKVTSMGIEAVKIEKGGTGYTSAPTIKFEGGGGSDATATAKINDGHIDEVEITNAGNGYTSAPKVVIEGGGGSDAVLKSSLTIMAVEVTAGGSGYKAKRIVSTVGEGGGAALEAELGDNGAVTGLTFGKHWKTGKRLGGSFTSVPKLAFPEPGIPFIDALELLQSASGAVFFGVSFLITIALAFYYAFTALYFQEGLHVKPENVGPLMTIGQWVEIIFMLSLGWFIDKWGMRWVLIVGMAAWALRYGIFAAMPPLGIAVIGIALHGICFDFFLGAGFIHTDNIAAPEIKASAQALFGVLTYGLGMYVGTEAAGWLNQYFTKEVVVPAAGTENAIMVKETGISAKPLEGTAEPQAVMTIKVTDWQKFWLVPCIGAAICLVLFLLFFKV